MKIENLKMKKLSTLNSQLSTRKGFTLIELLIVIAIIGVLATILLVNFMGVRQRTRDAQRKADLRQIQSAIELYKADQGVYPPVVVSPDRLNSVICLTSASLVGGTITYLAKIPCDPSGTGNWNSGNYYYNYSSATLTYTLGACIENANDADSQATSTNPSLPIITGCASSKYYVLKNP